MAFGLRTLLLTVAAIGVGFLLWNGGLHSTLAVSLAVATTIAAFVVRRQVQIGRVARWLWSLIAFAAASSWIEIALGWAGGMALLGLLTLLAHGVLMLLRLVSMLVAIVGLLILLIRRQGWQSALIAALAAAGLMPFQAWLGGFELAMYHRVLLAGKADVVREFRQVAQEASAVPSQQVHGDFERSRAIERRLDGWVFASPEFVHLELGGGFFHFGYNFWRDPSGKAWHLSWEAENARGGTIWTVPD